jgi:hypothetical protein
MLTSLNMYTLLEVPLLQETNEYYQAEGKAFMDACDVRRDRTVDWPSLGAVTSVVLVQVPKYLLRVESRFQEEASRGQAYLDPLTRRPLTEILEKQLISAHVTAMLDKGVWWPPPCAYLVVYRVAIVVWLVRLRAVVR